MYHVMNSVEPSDREQPGETVRQQSRTNGWILASFDRFTCAQADPDDDRVATSHLKVGSDQEVRWTAAAGVRVAMAAPALVASVHRGRAAGASGSSRSGGTIGVTLRASQARRPATSDGGRDWRPSSRPPSLALHLDLGH